jgi:hypothetical protein
MAVVSLNLMERAPVARSACDLLSEASSQTTKKNEDDFCDVDTDEGPSTTISSCSSKKVTFNFIHNEVFLYESSKFSRQIRQEKESKTAGYSCCTIL